MIVEDEDVLREVMKDYLLEEGYRVIEAEGAGVSRYTKKCEKDPLGHPGSEGSFVNYS